MSEYRDNHLVHFVVVDYFGHVLCVYVQHKLQVIQYINTLNDQLQEMSRVHTTIETNNEILHYTCLMCSRLF